MREPLPRRAAATCALVALLSTLGFGQTADWYQWRGPARDGKSTETGLLKDWPPGGPPLLWRSSGFGIGFSSFSSGDGRLYTLGDRGDKGYVFALEASTGKKIWETPNGANYRNSNGDGTRGTPTIDGDRLYVMGPHGDLACLDSATGRVVWNKNVVREFRGEVPQWGYAESPLVVGGRVLVQTGGSGAAIVALDKMTGAAQWRSQSDRAGYSSAVLAQVGGTSEAVFFTDDRALGVDIRDGKLLWSYDRANNGTANIATPVVNGNRVFVSSAYDTGAALLELAPTGAKEMYFTRQMMNHHSTSVLVGDYLYGFSNTILTALRFADGKVAWQNRSVGKGSVIYADQRLYLYSEDGVIGLAEANPSAYVEHGRFRIKTEGEPTWSHPIITNGRLIIRDQGSVYAYDIRMK
jgi:outer membrane protein assembly factor BamB